MMYAPFGSANREAAMDPSNSLRPLNSVLWAKLVSVSFS